MVPFKFYNRKVSLMQSNNKVSLQTKGSKTRFLLLPIYLRHRPGLNNFWYILFSKSILFSLGNCIFPSQTDLRFYGQTWRFGLFNSHLHLHSIPKVGGENTHTTCRNQLQSIQDSGDVAWYLHIWNTFSNTFMNHIEESKVVMQTNPIFSWVSEQLHRIWSSVNCSWLN